MHARSPRPIAPPRPELRLVADVPQPAQGGEIARQWLAFGLLTAMLFGTLVRASFVLAADFPLNDGGMFYTMAADLQANGYRLPTNTTYNLDVIPFAYPPLGIYTAACLEAITPLKLLDVFRFLPLTVSVLNIAAFALLSRRLLRNDIAFLTSVFAYAFTPFSFEWFIMGGGVTRSFGLLFALLALHEAHRLYSTNNRVCVLTLGIFGGLAALSHLEVALFVAFSTSLFFVALGRTQKLGVATAVSALIAIAVSAPWWITVLTAHGMDPLIAAARTGSPSPVNPILTFLVFDPTDEPLFAIIAATALLGVIWSLARGLWLFPAWVLACGLLDPRGFGNVASVPVALLAGVAVAEVLFPLMTSGSSRRSRVVLPASVLGFAAAYALIGALVATPQLLGALEPDERAAMAWIAANTPENSTVAVVTDEVWPRDRSSEWFPVLAGRRSIATVQGSEWIRGAFTDRVDAHEQLQLCAEQDVACLEAWAAGWNESFDLIYLPKQAESTAGPTEHPDECCAALRQSLFAASKYTAVYDGPGATIFRRN